MKYKDLAIGTKVKVSTNYIKLAMPSILDIVSREGKIHRLFRDTHGNWRALVLFGSGVLIPVPIRKLMRA